MRVFKNKWFTRWARKEGIPDSTLWGAAVEIHEGRVDADLGGYLIKKRLARPGKGKSGGYRTIVGYKKPDSERIIFLYAFAKNKRANISTEEEAALSLAAQLYVNAPKEKIQEFVMHGLLKEIDCHV